MSQNRFWSVQLIAKLIRLHIYSSRHSFSTTELKDFRQSLLAWYDGCKRDLPWRTTVVTELDGKLPQSAESLQLQLPGVGRYTASAVASIAFDERVPVLDGNVMRVLTRCREIGSPIQTSTTNAQLWELAGDLVDPTRPGDFNQALMELGAVCCTPKQPNCSVCPLGTKGLCGSYSRLQTTSPFCHSTSSSLGVMNYPVKLNKKAARTERTLVIVVNAHIGDRTHFLLFQRPKTGLLAGLWEFPSHTIIDTESKVKSSTAVESSALMERITKALGTSSMNNQWTPKPIGEVLHVFSHIRMTYMVHVLQLPSSHDKLPELQTGQWIDLEGLSNAPVSTANRKIFAHFQNANVVKLEQTDEPHADKRTESPRRKSARGSKQKSGIASPLVDAKQMKLDSFFN